MNLREERNYQMRMEVLQVIGLAEANQKIAEDYLDMEKEERRELLEKVERQNFAILTKEQKVKSVDYVDHLKKRKQDAERERYMRLMFAIGGSTSTYVLSLWGYSAQAKEIFGEAQAAAIQAEVLVWNSHLLNDRSLSLLWNAAKKDPEILREAIEYCYNPINNAQLLLRAIYLNCKKPESNQGGLIKGIFSGKEKDEELKKQVAVFEKNIVDAVSPLFQMKLSREQEEELQTYVNAGNWKKPLPVYVGTLRAKHVYLDYLLHFLAGIAFLALEHTKKAAAFLKITAELDYEAVYKACEEMAEDEWFYNHEELLEMILDIDPSEYILLNVYQDKKPAVVRLVEKYPKAAERALKDLDAEQYGYLLEAMKEGNPSLYKQLHGSNQSGYFEKMANEVVKEYGAGKAEAKAYLLGNNDLESLYPFISDYKKSSGYGWNKGRLVRETKKRDGEAFYRRALVFLGVAGENYALNCLVEQKNVKAIEEMMEVFEVEKVPVDIQLEIAETVHNGYYTEQSQTFFINELVKLYGKKKEEWGDALAIASKESNVIGRFIAIRFMDIYKEDYKEQLLACATDGSKMVKELLEAVYTSCPQWEEHIKEMLLSKKSQEREMAVIVLKKWGASKYQAEFQQALEKEKSKKVKELLAACLGVKSSMEAEGEDSKNNPDSLVQQLHKGGKKRKIQWAYETPFVTVHKMDGKEAGEEYLQAVALCYADMALPGANKQAILLAENLNENEFAIYAAEMFDKWLESGAEAKKKWVLYFASIHGGEVIVPKLVHQINEWPKLARGAIAAEAVKALALNGSQTALLTVDGISRKFKFKQVKSAAGEALEYAASELGISKEELADKIVPDLGFDEEAKRIFDYGERSFSVYLTPALELEVYDDNQKKLKNLPSPGKKDNPELAAASYEQFKLMKKQLKTVLTNQKQRLEMALSAERCWSVDKWQELFVKNPVMHQFAISLIWGIYGKDGLEETFRYMEDGSFNTKDEDEFEMPAEGSIGLVHPIELDEEAKEQWKEQLSDYEVTQAIEQLERTVYEMTEQEKNETVMKHVAGKIMNAMSLSGKLQGMGWYRGSIQDGGCYDTFYREDAHMAVELTFSGTFVGGELEEEITVYGAKFYKPGTVERGSYVYDEIKEENLYKLGDVSPRYFSEIVYQLEKATASSTESEEISEEWFK